MEVVSKPSVAALACELESVGRSSDRAVQELLDVEERSRKSLFPWRGQFSPQLVEYLISEHFSAGADRRIVDPFCGSGTVLAEAARYRIAATGFDVNPAAALFASTHAFANCAAGLRREIVADVQEYLCARNPSSLFSSDAEPHPSVAVLELEGLRRSLFAVSLMLAMGDQNQYSIGRHEAALHAAAKTVLAMPTTNAPLVAKARDSRTTGLDDRSVDLVITSPPYINVFNYHQNYRTALEVMGWEPLAVAVAEIGANRKHRQNRFLTVVQYCIDVAISLCELRRIVKQAGAIVFVVGRSSNVRGVPFKNGLLIGLVGRLCASLEITQWRERRYLNRFGEHIFEDIITFQPVAHIEPSPDAPTVGRMIGVWALEQALVGSAGTVREDIVDAIARVPYIMPSPSVRVNAPRRQPCPVIDNKERTYA